MQCDASLAGLSFVLGQTDDDGRKYVVSYGGRGLRPCEKRWPITQLECLSLLTGIREYHVYLVHEHISDCSELEVGLTRIRVTVGESLD